MAARYSKGGVIAAGSLAKRFTDRALASNSRPPLFTGTVALCSSSSSSSSYDKYWAPHPKTGVFGPAGSGTHRDAAADGGSPSSQAPSVMDQTAWFRPLEDVDKPPPSSLA